MPLAPPEGWSAAGRKRTHISIESMLTAVVRLKAEPRAPLIDAPPGAGSATPGLVGETARAPRKMPVANASREYATTPSGRRESGAAASTAAP
jgi:hypothetical protein